MAWKPHWNDSGPKIYWAQDVNELLVELSGDPTDALKHPMALSKDDLRRLQRVLEKVKGKLNA